MLMNLLKVSYPNYVQHDITMALSHTQLRFSCLSILQTNLLMQNVLTQEKHMGMKPHAYIHTYYVSASNQSRIVSQEATYIVTIYKTILVTKI